MKLHCRLAFTCYFSIVFCSPSSYLVKAAASQTEIRVSVIDLYGYTGLNVKKVRAALPIHEDDKFQSVSDLYALRPKIEAAVLTVTGRPPTDVAAVSPGGNIWFVFIGLSGNSTKAFPFNPPPVGKARLSRTALELHERMDSAFEVAMRNGDTGEDDAAGYALSSDNSELRSSQQAVRQYALQHADELHSVVRESVAVKDRQIAAQFVGYANQSPRQIADLVWASRDPDFLVRNNAIRALGVLASSSTKIASRIPFSHFVDMLNSGKWADRNKAAFLLVELTKTRPANLMRYLREHAIDSLVEMAKWHSTEHGYFSRVLLGRLGGIQEARLQQLAVSKNKVDVIITAALAVGHR